MKSRTAGYRRPSALKRAFVAISGLALGVGVTLVGLVAFGVIDLSAFNRKATRDPYAGMVAVPLSGTAIPIYAVVTRDHMATPGTLVTRVLHYPPDKVPADFITDHNKIIGRVMAREKQPGYAFTERDFLPVGTRPGIVAGIPPGKRAMTLDANQVRGLKDLRIGDRFDLLASEPVETSHLQPSVRAGGVKGGGKDASVKVMVSDGRVVTRAADETAATDGGRSHPLVGGGGKKDPARDMTIALDPDEIAPLTEALATKASLFCVARSGRPEETHDTEVPELDPLKHVRTVETVRGRAFGAESFGAHPAEAATQPATAIAPNKATVPMKASPPAMPQPATAQPAGTAIPTPPTRIDRDSPRRTARADR